MYQRLFYAILFQPYVLKHLSARIEAMREAGIRGRFTRTENLHLTLQFIGDVKQDRLPVLCDVLDFIAEKETVFDIATSEIGSFGRRGDIVWLGVERCDALISLQNKLTKELRNAGLPYENRLFRPHITLIRNAKYTPSDLLDQKKQDLVLKQTVESISLMESCVIGKKRVYQVIRNAALRT